MRRRCNIFSIFLLALASACAVVDPTIPICRDSTRRVWRPGHHVGRVWCPGFWDDGRTPPPACTFSKR